MVREIVFKSLAEKARELYPAPQLLDFPFLTLRTPLGKQGEAIRALVSAFKRGERVLFLSGKEGDGIGVGKTHVAISTAMSLLEGRGRALVLAPPHITSKWQREVLLDGGVPRFIRTPTELLRALETPPQGVEFFILSKDRAKREAPLREGVWRRRSGTYCPDCGVPIKNKPPARCPVCGTPLWGYSGTPGLGDFLRRRIGEFSFLILDEAHVYRNPNTQQGGLALSLAGKIPTLLLSGTLMGGFASDLYYLLRSANPERIEGISLGDFIEAYGAKVTVSKVIYTPDRIHKSETTKPAPGFTPQLLPLVIDKTYFLGLKEVGELPPYREKVLILEPSEEAKRYLGDLQSLYLRFRKLGPRYLTPLAYAGLHGIDLPGVEYLRLGEEGEKVGVSPIPPEKLSPKEKALLLLCREARARGEKVVIFVEASGVWDVQPRLWEILRDDGHRPFILTREVPPEKRMALLEEVSPDILIANPRLVETGLDLVEYTTAIFYQPPASAFTLRQAGRRLYRLGQRKTVRLFYMAYTGAQESLLSWVGEKVRQSLLFEGGYGSGDVDLFLDEDPLEVALKAFLGEVRKLSFDGILSGGTRGGEDLPEPGLKVDAGLPPLQGEEPNGTPFQPPLLLLGWEGPAPTPKGKTSLPKGKGVRIKKTERAKEELQLPLF